MQIGIFIAQPRDVGLHDEREVLPERLVKAGSSVPDAASPGSDTRCAIGEARVQPL